EAQAGPDRGLRAAQVARVAGSAAGQQEPGCQPASRHGCDSVGIPPSRLGYGCVPYAGGTPPVHGAARSAPGPCAIDKRLGGCLSQVGVGAHEACRTSPPILRSGSRKMKKVHQILMRPPGAVGRLWARVRAVAFPVLSLTRRSVPFSMAVGCGADDSRTDTPVRRPVGQECPTYRRFRHAELDRRSLHPVKETTAMHAPFSRGCWWLTLAVLGGGVGLCW